MTADLLAFLAASPTPFHAVAEASQRLAAAGFTRLDEADAWDALAGGGYYVTSSDTNLVAFVLPERREHRTSYRIVGAHTDSPNLRLKPNAEYTAEGYAQLGVEVYGGALLNSWLDRDLGLAGRVLVRADTDALATRLVDIARPILRIPQLAIHLDREVNDKGLVLNRQDHLAPVARPRGRRRSRARWSRASSASTPARSSAASSRSTTSLPPALGGAANEFIFSARLDNLGRCRTRRRSRSRRQSAPTAISAIALFDHEEVGSESAAGAASAVLPRLLERLAPDRDAFLRACARSTCISADMAHAVHPNYASRHEARHKPHA